MKISFFPHAFRVKRSNIFSPRFHPSSCSQRNKLASFVIHGSTFELETFSILVDFSPALNSSLSHDSSLRDPCHQCTVTVFPLINHRRECFSSKDNCSFICSEEEKNREASRRLFPGVNIFLIDRMSVWMPPGRPSSTVRQVGVGINIVARRRIEVNDKSSVRRTNKRLGKGQRQGLSRTTISNNSITSRYSRVCKSFRVLVERPRRSFNLLTFSFELSRAIRIDTFD